MLQPVWRIIVSELVVPEPHKQWKLALEYLTAGTILMLEVVEDPVRNVVAKWTPDGFTAACSPDGDFEARPRGAASTSGQFLVTSAPLGALIARIGGSTEDQSLDTGTTPARIAFSIGRKCVFTVPTSPTGSLFLGVNDDPSRVARVAGQLRVNIFEAV